MLPSIAVSQLGGRGNVGEIDRLVLENLPMRTLCNHALVMGALVISLLLEGCLSALTYYGDGNFSDEGPFSAIDRYVIDFGSIDLRKVGSFEYEFGNLPNAGFKLGFDITFDGISLQVIRGKPITARVAVRVVAQDGTEIFNHELPLDKWNWGELSAKPNNVLIWLNPGTYFRPVTGMRYRLYVAIRDPDHSNLAYRAKLVIKGGGWTQP